MTNALEAVVEKENGFYDLKINNKKTRHSHHLKTYASKIDANYWARHLNKDIRKLYKERKSTQFIRAFAERNFGEVYA